MVRQALILIPVVIVLTGAKGCQTIEQRATAAAAIEGEAKAKPSFPDLPVACTAKVGRVRPGDEPRVVTLKRWEVVADLRDRQAQDCAAWGADMKAEVIR